MTLQEKTMTYNGPLNVSRETWATPQQTSLSNRAKSMGPEMFAIAITETDGMPAACRNLSVPGALKHVFESDGTEVVITFAKRTNHDAGFRPKPFSTGVQ